MEDLTQKRCVPCEGGVPSLKREEIDKYLAQLKGGWLVSPKPNGEGGEVLTITKEFKFKDFKEAMNFVNKVADIANKDDHHPDITIHYSKVEILLWTHAIGGLSENDFIVAAKIDELT